MRLERKDAARVVRKVIDLGVNLIDTANSYGGSEEKIGEAIRGINRESLLSGIFRSFPQWCRTPVSNVQCQKTLRERLKRKVQREVRK